MPDSEFSFAPIQHVLRPHHVGLILVFFTVFDNYVTTSHPMLLHCHRVLLLEVSERTEPKPYDEILNELEHGLSPQPSDATALVTMMRDYPESIDTVERLSELLKEIPQFWTESEDEMFPSWIIRRSYFGNFLRRCYVSFTKLSFEGLANLLHDFLAWVNGDTSAGYHKVQRDKLKIDSYITRTLVDRAQYAEPDAYASYQKSIAVGDIHQAVENLRRFFEQKFHDSSDSEIRQHAMLNLARTYFTSGQSEEARKIVLEAITVARTMGDNVTLQHCMSLLRRFTPSGRHVKLPLNELQADVSPMEVLCDVTKLLHESQPLDETFQKIVQANAIYDIYHANRDTRSDSGDQWAFHAMQSAVWRLAGCEQLAIIEENIVLAFSESGGSSDIRLSATLNKSQRLARSGQYDNAIALLLDPETWKGLDSTDSQFRFWATAVWEIMAMISSRRSQFRHFKEWLRSTRPSLTTIASKKFLDYILVPPEKSSIPIGIEGSLYKALQMRRYDQATTVVDQTLKALWQSEYEGRYRIHRLALVLLADVGLEFGMTEWCRKLIDEAMPQIIRGDDIELRAFACYVQGRCIIACSGRNFEGLRDSIPYLEQAEVDYEALEMKQAVLDVQYVVSVVYHNLGMEAERDRIAARHLTTEKLHKEIVAQDVSAQYKEVWKLVSEIGSALASR